MQFHMWPSVVFTDIRLKMWTGKNSQVYGSLRENVSVFLSHLPALISRRNVGTRGHLRKEIVLLKYQFFRFRTKTGGQFELLNWWRKAQGFWCWRIMILFILPSVRMVSKLSSMLRNMHNKKIRTRTTVSASSIFTDTRIPLFNLYTTANDKSSVRFRMLWRLYKFKF